MPRVLISVREVVTYSREIEMSEADWRQWDEKTDQRGKAHDKAVEELASHFIRRDEDWQDADDLQLMELSLQQDKGVHRESGNCGHSPCYCVSCSSRRPFS